MDGILVLGSLTSFWYSSGDKAVLVKARGEALEACGGAGSKEVSDVWPG